MLIMIKEEGQADVLARSLASTKGEWSQSRLIPGQYRLKFQRQDGSNWGSEDFTLTAEDGDHSIDVRLTNERVTGKVTLGDRPIAAEVHFGGENGPGFVADEDGRFEGLVPPAEDEEVTLLVTSETPDIKRTLSMKGERSQDGELYFEIALPETTIMGRVIHEDGSPEPRAMVTIQAAGYGPFLEQMFVRPDGTFQFSGFEPGVYSLLADTHDKASSVIEIKVRSDETASTDLVLRAEEIVRGRVVMKGMAIGGARVKAWPRDVPVGIIPETTTDAAGRFVLKLPSGTQTYDAAVFSPGFYVTIGRVTRDPKMNLRVDVGQDGGSLTVDTPVDDNLRLKHAGGDFALPWIVMEAGGVDKIENGRRRLTIPALEAGQYSICGQELGCKSVYVPQFATASVKLDE
jgi:hypothetical protein